MLADVNAIAAAGVIVVQAQVPAEWRVPGEVRVLPTRLRISTSVSAWTQIDGSAHAGAFTMSSSPSVHVTMSFFMTIPLLKFSCQPLQRN